MYVCMYKIQIVLMTAHMYPEIEVVQTHRHTRIRGLVAQLRGKITVCSMTNYYMYQYMQTILTKPSTAGYQEVCLGSDTTICTNYTFHPVHENYTLTLIVVT